MINRRLIERDYMFKKIKNNSEYIADDQINKLLDEHSWCDLTFRFIEKVTGYKIIVLDNDTGTEVAIDDLNRVAYDFMIRNVESLSVQRAKNLNFQSYELLHA
ncbi:hypothetical protein NV379_02350 [Paenibacillus sp. N1-5-1-14]|uniref:hypothetical protein n=1 Tax=Paenibacillus radicibacter TaxID=2972488 RepID=UPI002159B5B6|nr:hypothetical protein [Paenibacillus radicibacter]MCR8641488.1 hypothetical protein [Paenibacillus radicibacter]